jgi:hypothetical protein
MADPISALRVNRGEPTLFDQLSVAPQLTADQRVPLANANESEFVKGARRGAAGLSAGSFADEALRQEVGGNDAFANSRDLALDTSAQAGRYPGRVSSLRNISSGEDLLDFATGAVGQGAVSMAPALAGAVLTRGRGALGKATAFGGAAVPSYIQERGEAALDQYQDPTLAAAPVAERDTAATAKGLINAGLESIVPAGIGGAFLKKPAGSFLGHVAKDIGEEALTEGAQEVVGFGAKKYIDQNRELDPWDVVDAAVAGGLTGGAVSAAGRGPSHAAAAALGRMGEITPPGLPKINLPKFGSGNADAGADAPIEPDSGGGVPADTTLGKVAGLAGAVNDRFGESVADAAKAGAEFAKDKGTEAFEKAEDLGKKGATKAKSTIDDALDRMTEATKTAQSPADFMNQVFGGVTEEEAARDFARDDSHLKGNTFEETDANIQRDEAERPARAARYAQDLMDDPATPDAVKQRVASFGGDFSSPEAQDFVSKSLVSQRMGQKAGQMVNDVVAAAKDLYGKAKSGIDEATDAVKDRIVKKNLQFISPEEESAYSKVVFDQLTDEAKASPEVRANLGKLASSMVSFAAKTGDLKADDIPRLFKLKEAMSMFKDPDAAAEQILQYTGVPRDGTSFIEQVKAISSAGQDVKQRGSFLESAMLPDVQQAARQNPAIMNRIADLVDQFSFIDAKSSAKGTELVKGLANVFGSTQNAKMVLDYYAKQNKANLRMDVNETVNDDGSNPISERDGPQSTFEFADAKAQRPFSTLRGGRIKESTRAAMANPEMRTKPVPYSSYVETTGKDAEAEVRRIADDIKKRVAEGEKRVAAEPQRKDVINALKGELSAMRDAYKKGGAKAALDLFEVNETSDKEVNDTVATDEDIANYAKLDKDPSAKATRVTFQRTDGTKFTLSAESMWKTQGTKEGSGQGEGQRQRALRLFKDAVASVLARPEVEKVITTLDGVVLDRRTKQYVKPLRDKEYRDTVEHALNESRQSIGNLRTMLGKITDEYQDLLQEDGDIAESRREEIEDTLQQRIDNTQAKIDELFRTEGTLPAQTVLKAKLAEYKAALTDVRGMKFEDEFQKGDEQRSAVPGDNAKKDISRSRAEDSSSRKARRYEEDTGKPLGTGGAPSMPAKEKPQAKVKEAPAAKDLPEGRTKVKLEDSVAAAAESTRESAEAIDNHRALSDAAMTALYDIVVRENYERLDTPEKALKFVSMAQRAREQFRRIDEAHPDGDWEDYVTHDQASLAFKLEQIFQKGHRMEFDWDMFKSELDMSDAQAAELDRLVKKNQQSSMRGFPDDGITTVMDKAEKQKIYDEIVRLRGKDIKVLFGKFAQIKGSGEFSMNADRTGRLIKIAIDSLNPMSVAWHESLHDFFNTLGGTPEERQVKADLLQSASAPQVMVKLRELLKGHPEALKQIETDPEERLAYMYQFWAEGELKLGPTGTNIFTRLANFVRGLLGIVSQDQKSLQILEAFHDGKLSDPSIAAHVIKDLQLETLNDKLKRVAGPVFQLSEAMYSGATDRLRNTNIKALGELADMFHREPGREGGGLPFLQNRAQQVGKRLNTLQDVLGGTTNEQRARALENMQAMKKPSSPLERNIKAWLEQMHDYMTESGVKMFDPKTKAWKDMGRVENYFPRVWDKEIIRNKEAEFLAALEPYIGKAQARETFNALTNGDGSLELAENEHALGFTPWNPAVLNRQFTFINESNAHEFSPFQSKDMTEILTSYAQRAVHRAEYAKTFGNGGEVVAEKLRQARVQGATAEELTMAVKATMAMEGTLGHDFNPRLKEAMSAVITFENVILLPMALFSSLIDPLGVAMRSNDMSEAWGAFKSGIKGIADQVRKKGPDEQAEMAKLLGLIDDQNMLDAMGQVYNSMHMSKFLKKVNTQFFKFNGMEIWNQRMRVAAMMAAQRFIVKNLDHSRYMDELGIDKSDVFALPDGTIALTKDQIQAAMGGKIGSGRSPEEIEKRIQAAVFKFVDGAVLRPNAAHRPIWGSDPRFSLIFHLKQFTFSFQQTILARVGSEFEHGNVTPALILASYVPFMFLSDVLKGSLTGTLGTTQTLWDIAQNSVARSGVLGTGVFGNDALEDIKHGNLPGTSFLGPAFDHINQLLKTVAGRESVSQFVDRSVPFAKYFGE